MIGVVASIGMCCRHLIFVIRHTKLVSGNFLLRARALNMAGLVKGISLFLLMRLSSLPMAMLLPKLRHQSCYMGGQLRIICIYKLCASFMCMEKGRLIQDCGHPFEEQQSLVAILK